MYSQQQFNQMYQNPYLQQNVLPQQQIMTANGYDSVRMIKMAPNSSALIADETKPLLYKCVSDSIGSVTVTVFDISPHQEPPQMDVSRMEALMAELSAGIQSLNNVLANMASAGKEVKQDEPAARTAKSSAKS